MKRRKDIASKLLLIAEVQEMRAAADAAAARRKLREAVEDVEALDAAEALLEDEALSAPQLSVLELEALFTNRRQVAEARVIHHKRVRSERRVVAETAERYAARTHLKRTREHIRDHVQRQYRIELERREEDELDDLTAVRWGR